MKIDGEIEALHAQPADERKIRCQPRAWRDDDLVQVRIRGDERRGMGFDEVGEVRVRETRADAPDCRRREHDIANLTKTDQKDPGNGVAHYPITPILRPLFTVTHCSMVASSISMTGISSLMA